MEMAVWILFCLFSSVGLVQCGIWLFGAFKGPQKALGGYRIIPLYDKVEELESKIRLGLAHIRNSDNSGELLLLVDMGLGEESREICGRLLQDFYGVYICSKDELPEVIEHFENLQNLSDDVE